MNFITFIIFLQLSWNRLNNNLYSKNLFVYKDAKLKVKVLNNLAIQTFIYVYGTYKLNKHWHTSQKLNAQFDQYSKMLIPSLYELDFNKTSRSSQVFPPNYMI